MDKFKVVNERGNDATESQVFGYIAYQLMEMQIRKLIENGKVIVAGNEFTLTPEALEKLEGIKSHIANRWDKPIEAVKIVTKKSELQWEL